MFTLTSQAIGRPVVAALALMILFGGAVAPASADDRHGHDRHDDRHDGNYRHGAVVPPGHRVRSLPPRYSRVVVHHRNYYYQGGVFYRPYYQNYVVVGAPIGARVGWLPPGYVSFGLGGHNYSYFNATFYLYDPPRREYVVVEKPPGADEALAGAPGLQDAVAELYVYPARGQSEDQTRRDRYECHLWSVDQTQFDPSMGHADAAQSGEYRRATTACLEGRGYTVR